MPTTWRVKVGAHPDRDEYAYNATVESGSTLTEILENAWPILSNIVAKPAESITVYIIGGSE